MGGYLPARPAAEARTVEVPSASHQPTGPSEDAGATPPGNRPGLGSAVDTTANRSSVDVPTSVGCGQRVAVNMAALRNGPRATSVSSTPCRVPLDLYAVT